MIKFKDHVISSNTRVSQALLKLNKLNLDTILFVLDKNGKLIGSVTDGDIRRGLINGATTNSSIQDVLNSNPRFIYEGENNVDKIIKLRKKNFKIIPVINKEHEVIDLLNFRESKSALPLDVIIMAGGKGKRLMPLTKSTPKPLLKVGDKSILEHNLDKLMSYGMTNIWITLNYMGEKIKNQLSSRIEKINYVEEKKTLGTIGAASLISNFENNFILIMNSDILSDLNYESFFIDFMNLEADMSILSIPFNVDIQYGVIETNHEIVSGIKEKPTYTYLSNGGIYLIKKSVLEFVPKNSFFNATDLIEVLIKKKKKVISYSYSGYWLDIGKHEDYQRAQEEIKYINL